MRFPSGETRGTGSVRSSRAMRRLVVNESPAGGAAAAIAPRHVSNNDRGAPIPVSGRPTRNGISWPAVRSAKRGTSESPPVSERYSQKRLPYAYGVMPSAPPDEQTHALGG